mgnify:CR=1 FL=1|tara:strand:- start:17012 stop:18433 length:1422 start_codon:yes stop_codon:yes gene_type:complete
MSKVKQTPGCPPPPDLKTQTTDIAKTMDSIGANQKCKSAFKNQVDASEQKGDAAVAFATFGGVGGGSASFTNSQNHMKESLDKSGCSDVFANVNQQLSAQQSMLCSINNKKSTTSLAGSANATITIKQMPSTPAMIAAKGAAVAALLTKPVPPQYVPGMPAEVFKQQEADYHEQVAMVTKAIDDVTGKVVIEDSTFKMKANVDMQSISNMKEVDHTAIATAFKTAAKAQAMTDLHNKTGLGANSDTVKSLVTSRINSKNQSITDNIKNTLSSVNLKASSGGHVIIEFYGAFTMKDVIIDQYVQARLIAKNLMTSASNLGSSVANQIMQDSATATKSTKDSSGEGAVLKQIYDGQVALSKANSEGMNKAFSSLTGFMSAALMIPLIIGAGVLLFMPEVSNVIAPGPLKYVLAAVLLYFVLAYFIGFWPFGKSEKKHEDEDYDERDIFPDGLGFIRTVPPKSKHPYRRHHFSAGY